MSFLMNPVIPGMAPDPSIIRVKDTYYIATSTFHWNPGIQLYESKDLQNWETIGFALKNQEVNLRGTDTPGGIWAPNLSYDPITETFWLMYSHMQNMNGREFNADNFIMYSKNLTGPWSDPVYVTSIGFDPSVFHDDDGKKYLSILEWESRAGYQAPGNIVIAEIDLLSGKLLSDWNRVTKGFTTRGNAEAPNIYKKDNYYYLLIASGGTGYAHGIEIGRSRDIFGEYVPHPSNEPIITSSPRHVFSLGNPDAAQFLMFNPNSEMQKAGHGSLVETEEGEWYIAHLMARPLEGELLCPLGRETSIQKVTWTNDGWLELIDSTIVAKMQVPSPKGLSRNKKKNNIRENFNEDYSLKFMTPYREQSEDWVKIDKEKNVLRIQGGNSLFSKYNPSIMATKATSFNYELSTKMEYHPKHYSQTAGLGLYYDANNWLYVYMSFSEELNKTILSIKKAKNGERIDYLNDVRILNNCFIKLKIKYKNGIASIHYKDEEESKWMGIGEDIDVRYLSDEGVNGIPGEIGGFTGLFNFIGAVDSYQHTSFVDYHFYDVIDKE